MGTLNSIIHVGPNTRPCWVDGRRAIFHRWSDNARPVKPRGMEDDETVDHFQLHAVHAIVEYEDGTVGRVWPNMVQFADPERLFEEYDWEAMERQRDGELPFTYGEADAETRDTGRTCLTCGYVYHAESVCKEAEYTCTECKAEDCHCRKCSSFDLWEPKGGANG